MHQTLGLIFYFILFPYIIFYLETKLVYLFIYLFLLKIYSIPTIFILIKLRYLQLMIFELITKKKELKSYFKSIMKKLE